MVFTEWVTRSTYLLLDGENRIIGVLVGQPRNLEGPQGWKAVQEDALAGLKEAAPRLKFTDKEKRDGRRGPFPTIAHGLSFGGGQMVSKMMPASARSSYIFLGTRVSPS